MKWLRPRSADKPALLLVSDAELSILIAAVDSFRIDRDTGELAVLNKLYAELRTARKAL